MILVGCKNQVRTGHEIGWGFYGRSKKPAFASSSLYSGASQHSFPGITRSGMLFARSRKKPAFAGSLENLRDLFPLEPLACVQWNQARPNFWAVTHGLRICAGFCPTGRCLYETRLVWLGIKHFPAQGLYGWESVRPNLVESCGAFFAGEVFEAEIPGKTSG